MAIDFSLSPELEDIRTRMRTFIDEVVRPLSENIDDIIRQREAIPITVDHLRAGPVGVLVIDIVMDRGDELRAGIVEAVAPVLRGIQVEGAKGVGVRLIGMQICAASAARLGLTAQERARERRAVRRGIRGDICIEGQGRRAAV